MKKWSFISLLALMSLGAVSCGTKDDNSYLGLEETILYYTPKASDVCNAITECADYPFLNYRDYETCLIGVTAPVITVRRDFDGEKYVSFVENNCLNSFNELMTCESKLSCEDLVEVEYYGNTKGRLSKLCNKEYKALKSCLNKEDSCNCGECETCFDGVCMGVVGCYPINSCKKDSDCTTGMVCKNSKCVDPFCSSDKDCGPNEECIYGVCTSTENLCKSDSDCEECESCFHGICYAEADCDPSCKSDKDCDKDETCKEGKCTAIPDYCENDSQCDSHMLCMNNQCVEAECTTDADCEDYDFCMDGKCTSGIATPCKTNSECGECESCISGMCIVEPGCFASCTSNADCDTCSTCTDGICEAVPGCDLNYWCDTDYECDVCQVCGSNNHCMDVPGCTDECNSSNDCEDGAVCIDHKCMPMSTYCTYDWDCENGEVCINGACTGYENECMTNDDCNSDELCDDGLCVLKCKSDDECGDGYFCFSGLCWENIPESCTYDWDCESHEVCDDYQCIDKSDLDTCKTTADCEPCHTCTNGLCKSISNCTFCLDDSDCGACEACSPTNTCAPVANCQSCTSNNDCAPGTMCVPPGQCVPFTESSYNYIRIDDTSSNETSANKLDPGADIDAIVLSRNGAHYYAESVISYSRSDGYFSAKEKNWAADPLKALGAPDSTNYPMIDGTCKYYKNGSNSINNPLCAGDTVSASCDYDYTFVSLGGTGGYLIVEMDSTANGLKAGDKIDVLEIGDCSLKNTATGTSSLAKAEYIKISVTKDLENYKLVGDSKATKGVISFSISSGMLD